MCNNCYHILTWTTSSSSLPFSSLSEKRKKIERINNRAKPGDEACLKEKRQPSFQGLSSSRSRGPGGGKKRDPGKEIGIGGSALYLDSMSMS